MWDNLGLGFLSCLGCVSRSPCHAEQQQKIRTHASKATVGMSLFVIIYMTIGNCQKALIGIPYTVKHITKYLCFRLKNKIQILNGNNNNCVEWNRPRRKFFVKEIETDIRVRIRLT